jgi:hypothetical protein
MPLLISQEIKPQIRTKYVTRFLQLPSPVARLTGSYRFLQNIDELKIVRIKPNFLEKMFPTDKFPTQILHENPRNETGPFCVTIGFIALRRY